MKNGKLVVYYGRSPLSVLNVSLYLKALIRRKVRPFSSYHKTSNYIVYQLTNDVRQLTNGLW
jgi:hypothetical protein